MAAMVEKAQSITSIDKFIREQKQRLRQEREREGYGDRPPRDPSPRKKWDVGGPGNQKFTFAEQRPPLNRAPPSPGKDTGLRIGDSSYEEKKRKLAEERARDMQAAMQQQRNKGKKVGGKPALYDYDEVHQSWNEQRRRDYQELLAKSKEKKRHIISPEEGLRIGIEDMERRREERKKNIQHRKDLEKQRAEELLRKAMELRKTIDPPVVRVASPPPRASPPLVDIDRSLEEAWVKHAEKFRPPRMSPPPADVDRPPREAWATNAKKFRPAEGETEEELIKKHRQMADELQHEIEEEKRREREQSLQPQFDMEQHRKKINEETRQEMQEFLAKQKDPRFKKSPRNPPDEAPVIETFPERFGEHQETERQLYEQRHQDYLEQLQRQQAQLLQGRRAQDDIPSGATLPVGEESEIRRQQLEEERHREMVEHQLREQERLAETQRGRTGLPPKPATPNAFFKNLGAHDRQTANLAEERKKEYNQMIAAATTGKQGAQNSQEPVIGASLPGIRPHDSAEARKQRERNEEYNEFLKAKKEKDLHRFDHKKPPTAPRHGQPPPTQYPMDGRPASDSRAQVSQNKDAFATLPGLTYSDSAEKNKVKARNREYNEFLAEKARRKKGWHSPSYEDMLDSKRREEAQLRQGDPAFGGRLRSYASEGDINRLEDDHRLAELDRQIDARKVRFNNEGGRPPGGILEDDNWLEPERQREQQYKQLQPPPREEPMAARVQPRYNATLNVGYEETGSAKHRRQETYKKELQLQMQEAAAARKREKVQEMRVNATGFIDPEKSSNRMRGLGGESDRSPRREYKAGSVQPYHTKFLLDQDVEYTALGRRGETVAPGPAPATVPRLTDLSYSNIGAFYRGDGGGGFDGGRPSLIDRGRRRDNLNLDTNFGELFERRSRGVNVPPGLQYQPSTYVTAGGEYSGPYGSSIHDAYHYLGMQNPLDPGIGGGGGAQVPSLDFAPRGSSPRVRFDDMPSTRRRDRSRSKERISPYQFGDDSDFKSQARADQMQYQAELDRQIAEVRDRKRREKADRDRYDRKLEEEIKNYNPFGRGGGGAPNRDGYGNPITDLRSMHRENENPSSYRSVYASPPAVSPRPPSPRDDKIKPPPVQRNVLGETTFARGGHGIFGMPKTDVEKNAADRYKEELRLQIEDKRRRSEEDRKKQKEEDEREERRLDEQRQRMEKEYQEEQRKAREREEETRRKNEEMRLQAEERKKEQDRARREAEDKRDREKREQIENERREREQGQYSPRTKVYFYKQHTPAPPSNRPNSSDVLNQLSMMRKQLANERKRVENALENQKNDPDVFDVRLMQRAGPPNPGAFDKALTKTAVTVPRAQTSDLANARNLQEFNELKFKRESDSRQQFRTLFPENPHTNSALETQQESLLRQQEVNLRNLKERMLLRQAWEFEDVDRVNHFPEDFDDMPRRNDSARARRRDRYSPRVSSLALNGFGSQASIDPDRIAVRNEERLRRLQHQTDDISMGDPDDILDRFMAKQKHNSTVSPGYDKLKLSYSRPPSGNTLQDDSWLNPGSRP